MPELPPGARPVERSLVGRDALEVAPDLLGCLLVGGAGRVGRIVEVEAYRADDDPGSHAHRGRTPRNDPMWGTAGHLYVYFVYGMHHCANVVTGPEGVAQAVLIRAVAPEAGVDAMRDARMGGRAGGRTVVDRDLCRGPARTAQAFGLTTEHSGLDLLTPGGPVLLAADGRRPPGPVAVSRRVGLSAGADLPWRFSVAGHPAVSGPRLAGSP